MTQEATATVTHYFLTVEITVKEGKWALFKEYAERLLPVIAEKGWKLVAACSSITGVPNTVFHLWELPSANALLEGMVLFSENKLYSQLLACCQEQKQELLTSMPYNPLGANHS